VIVVTAPIDHTLGTPEIRVVASCIDDTPGCQVGVSINFLGTQALAVDGTLDAIIRPPDGEHVLNIYAVDAAGVYVSKHARVIVTSATTLRRVNQANDVLLDIDDTHLLTWSTLGPPEWPPSTTPATAAIYDRVTRLNPTIWTGSNGDERVTRGVLTPTGALLAVWAGGSSLTRLHEWRAGVLTDLGPIIGTSLVVNGRWALYKVAASSQQPQPLLLRDTTNGITTTVTMDAGYTDHDVTSDGRVFFWTDTLPHQLMEWTPGPPPTTTPLFPSSPQWNWKPVTDGSLVVFTRQLDGNAPISLMLRNADGSEITLTTTPPNSLLLPRDHYRAAGGWVAFVRQNADGGSMNVWLRAPDGTERQLTFEPFAYPTIESLRDNGEIIFKVNKTEEFNGPSGVYRTLVFPDGRSLDLGINIGTPVHTDGAWYLMAGPHLVAIEDAPSRAILAEGATGTFFTTDVAIFNPHPVDVPVTIRYLPESGSELTETRVLPAMSRTAIRENEIPALRNTSLSTVVEAPSTSPVAVERLMTWGVGGYGGHLATAVDRPSVRWFFAEGSQGFFNTYFLLSNSGAVDAAVTFTFLIEQGTPLTHTMTVPAGARRTVYAGDISGLIDRSFATVVESSVPIVAERAMYFGANPLWSGGHGSMGVREPSLTWTFSEGATGSFFDTFLLLANPSESDVTVWLSYVTTNRGAVSKQKTVPAFGRLTVNVEEEAPELQNSAVAIHVGAQAPIVAERALYWGSGGWRESHNSFGAQTSGRRWAVAEGRSRLERDYQTYILLANHGDLSSQVRLTFVREDGLKFERLVTVAAQRRFTVETYWISELANSRFSTLVEVVTGAPITVESTIYWNANGVFWEGGGNTVATRLQ